MKAKERYEGMVREIGALLGGVDAAKVDAMAARLAASPRIYCAGVGRSGYMMRAFTVRLMHCGLNAHFIGDSSTPGSRAGDTLVLGTGSGETESLKAYAAKAKKIGLSILTITTVPDSSLGKAADICLQLPAPTPKANVDAGFISIQPMGSLFEQCLLLSLDEMIMEIMDKMNLTAETMFKRHANLE